MSLVLKELMFIHLLYSVFTVPICCQHNKSVSVKLNLALRLKICFIHATYTGFSFDSKSAVPDSYFWAGFSTFQENLTKLHSGTPTFLKKCPWDSYFENPSENPGISYLEFKFETLRVNSVGADKKADTRLPVWVGPQQFAFSYFSL